MRISRLVLLHGFLGSPQTFDDVLAAIEPPPLALAPALYGHGGVREDQVERDFDAEVARLAQLIALKVSERPAHLVGYSLGARLALALLARAPQCFGSATLVSGRRGLDSADERQRRWNSDLQWAARLRSEPLSEFLDAWESQAIFASLRDVDPVRLRRLREQRLRHHPEGLARALLGLSLSKMPRFADELCQVRVPVTIVAGALDPKFVALGHDLLSRLPRSKMVVVQGSGHNVPIERPDAIAAAILEKG